MTFQRNYFGKGSVVVPSDDGQDVRRVAITADRLITQPFEGIDVIPDVIAYAARTHGTKEALGWRNIVSIHEEEKEVKKVVAGKEITEKKKWKYFELSDYQYLSFIEDNVFNIYAQTSANWQLMSHACTTIATPVATAYDTLGESGLTHSLNEPNCVGVFYQCRPFPHIGTCGSEHPFCEVGGSTRRCPREQETYKGRYGSDHVYQWDHRCTKGCCSYTCKCRICYRWSVPFAWTPLTLGRLFLAYLPLAHIMEYVVEATLFTAGMKTGYGRVKTLTDASVRKCKGDLVTFRPTIMVGVPAVWEAIQKGIIAKVNAGGLVKKNLFNLGYALKRSRIPILSQVADSVVFSSVRAATGGRLRLALSGGAALSKETQEFLCVALVTMLQGYGMTESCAMCAILPPELQQYGSVGLPSPSIEIKLRDVPEAGYKSTNNPPQGEVCIRGPAVTKGYYKRPDLNNDENIFTKDGWLRTGDVGQWNPDGTLSLIDRIKNLVKLQGGEYIALEQLETVYRSCNIVANICVYASAEAKQPIAILIPHELNLRHTLEGKLNGVDASAPLSELCHNKAVQELVLRECNAVGKKNGLKSMEMLEAVILTAEEWTPENGLVTAAQKLQRTKVAQHFEKEIKEVYRNQ
ncbi:acetyl-CoA synthetase-like protein [Pisolithus tinctorius]|nr:acetyl-CoA synthetase-like protein [Pisolithus tinctorius]